MNTRIMVSAVLSIMLIIVLSACDTAEKPYQVIDTVEVKVPVIERAEAPVELFRANHPKPEIPLWVSPSDPAATVALTAEGEKRLKDIMLRYVSLLDGWEKYASNH